jgi:hypothetical protein
MIKRCGNCKNSTDWLCVGCELEHYPGKAKDNAQKCRDTCSKHYHCEFECDELTHKGWEERGEKKPHEKEVA